MSRSFDVCIRGDGVVGHTLALLLARERLRVALVARPPASQSPETAPADVRAYALNSASRTLLQTLRAWPEPAFATPVLEMQVWGDSGGKLDFNARSLPKHIDNDPAGPALAWIVDVPELEQQLRQATRYQPHIEIVDEAPPAALTVICEGQKSSSRDELNTQVVIKSYAQKAIAARLVSDQPHNGVARQWFPAAMCWRCCRWAGLTGTLWRWSGQSLWSGPARCKNFLARRSVPRCRSIAVNRWARCI